MIRNLLIYRNGSKKNIIIILSTIAIFFISCKNEVSTNYFINPNIRDSLKGKIFSKAGITRGSVCFKMFENDSILIDTKQDCLINSSYSLLRDDTIFHTGYLGMDGGFGYQLCINKNNGYSVEFFARVLNNDFKVNEKDSFTSEIYVACNKPKLTLTKEPTFTKNESFQGIIEFTSGHFFEKNSIDTSKRKVQVIGYFSIDSLKTEIEE